MRRAHVVFVVVLLVAGTLGMAGPVAADPPSTDITEGTTVFCDFESELGFVDVYAVSFTSPEPETVGAVSIFEDYEEPPIIVTANPDDLTFGDGTFGGALLLVYEESGDPAGTATIAGTFEIIGEPELVEEGRYRAGNRWEEITVYVAPLEVGGSLDVAIDGTAETFDLADCRGEWVYEELWHTNPTSSIFREEGTELFCSLEQDGWFVEVFAFGGSDESWLDLVAWSPDTVPFEEEPTYFGYAEQFGFEGFGALEVEVPLWEPMMEEPTEVALIDAVLSEGDLFNIEARFQDGWLKVVETEVVVEGTLTLPEIALDMGACEGVNWAFRQHIHPDQSQGKGKVPANDLPDGAIELTSRDSIQTRMASEAPEVACVDPEFGEIPLGKTVWYTVEGTGEAMTVDTTGSDFDTVAGVYVMEGDELVQEACLDDNVDEAGVRNVVALTFETMPETTYYVQIGGFDAQYGHLKVALR
jgi:hypothetical protein